MGIRGGLAGKIYAWGDELKPGGQWMINTHQGQFPMHDAGADGYIGIAAVAQFPANGYGLYDMSGNVWQWTSDWYRIDYYAQLAAQGGVARNPQGPNSSYDPMEPRAAEARLAWRLILVHKSVLQPVCGGYPWQRGSDYGNESPGSSLREGCKQVQQKETGCEERSCKC